MYNNGIDFKTLLKITLMSPVLLIAFLSGFSYQLFYVCYKKLKESKK